MVPVLSVDTGGRLTSSQTRAADPGANSRTTLIQMTQEGVYGGHMVTCHIQSSSSDRNQKNLRVVNLLWSLVAKRYANRTHLLILLTPLSHSSVELVKLAGLSQRDRRSRRDGTVFLFRMCLFLSYRRLTRSLSFKTYVQRHETLNRFRLTLGAIQLTLKLCKSKKAFVAKRQRPKTFFSPFQIT